MALKVFHDLAFIKQHGNIDLDADDALLEAYENAAVLMGEHLTGRQFVAGDFTLELDCFPKSRCIDLMPNLNAVTSIIYIDTDCATQTLSTDQYQVKTKPLVGQVRLARDCKWPAYARDVVVHYNAGYAPPIPADLVFTDDSARDAYFNVNPGELTQGLWILSNGMYQRLEANAFVNYPAAKPVENDIKAWLLVKIADLYEQRESFVTGTIVSKMPGSFIDCILDKYKIYTVA